MHAVDNLTKLVDKFPCLRERGDVPRKPHFSARAH